MLESWKAVLHFWLVVVPVLSFGLLIALGPHSIQKVMDKRDFDGKIHTHSTQSTNSTKFKLTRLITNNQKNNNKK